MLITVIITVLPFTQCAGHLGLGIGYYPSHFNSLTLKFNSLHSVNTNVEFFVCVTHYTLWFIAMLLCLWNDNKGGKSMNRAMTSYSPYSPQKFEGAWGVPLPVVLATRFLYVQWRLTAVFPNALHHTGRNLTEDVATLTRIYFVEWIQEG